MQFAGGVAALEDKIVQAAVVAVLTPVYEAEAARQLHAKLPHKLYLFYSNRRPEDAAFMPILQELEKENPNFKFIPSMSEMSKSAQTWNGESGFINRDMLAKHLPNLQGPIYYIAGPPAMAAAMRQMLSAAGVDEDDLRRRICGLLIRIAVRGRGLLCTFFFAARILSLKLPRNERRKEVLV